MPADPFLPARTLLESSMGTAAPGAVLRVSRGEEERFVCAAGTTACDGTGVVPAPVTPDTVFDLASVTKPLATTAVALSLLGEGRIALEDPVGRHVAGLAPPLARVPLACLLAHTSGLPAWRPFAADLAGTLGPTVAGTAAARETVRARIASEPLATPPGTACVYSDLGFILLAWALEQAGGEDLDAAFRHRVARPLGLCRTFFVPVRAGVAAPLPVPAAAVAATERCPTRGRVLVGEVHDDNAWLLGGVAGHAGLFSTAGETARIAGALRDAWAGLPSPFPPDAVRRAWSREFTPPGSSRLLGFDTPSPSGSMAGDDAPPGTVGHLGYTGTSFWIDRDTGTCVVLLTNRVHPTRANDAIRALRPRLHDLAWAAAGLPPRSRR